MTLRNNGEESVVIQLELLKWAQQNGQDTFSPTNDILATPPIFTVPAGGSQLIRIGMRGVSDSTQERSYRMFMQEVPRPTRPGLQGLQVTLRLSVPIFVSPVVETKPVLVWKVISAPTGQIKLRSTNVGNAHIQIVNFKLTRMGGEELSNMQAAAYILPGESREWIISSKAAVKPDESLHLVGKTDGDDVRVDIRAEAP